MTQVEKILNYLWSVAPEGATNRQIAEATGIHSQQGVYMTTQDLIRRRLIRGERIGKIWYFYALDTPEIELAKVIPLPPAGLPTDGELTPAEFETLARKVMSQHYKVSQLSPGKINNIPKKFDFVSPDEQIVGDAKYYTRVGGTGLPPAKFSVIAEYVWLLEKTGARQKFLVFGNDREVSRLWLKRYGHLVTDIAFYFLSASGDLEQLSEITEP